MRLEDWVVFDDAFVTPVNKCNLSKLRNHRQSSRTDTSYVGDGQNRKESPRGDDPLFIALTPGGDRRRVITVVQNIRY